MVPESVTQEIVNRAKVGVPPKFRFSPNLLSGQLNGKLVGENVPGPFLVRVVHLVPGQVELLVAGISRIRVQE